MADGKWISGLAPSTPITDAARRVLALRLEAVRDAVLPVLRQTTHEPDYIHQLRVCTRRAGAGLEIFAGCLPPREGRTVRRCVRRLRRVAGAARDWDVFLASVSSQEKVAERWRPAFAFLAGHALTQRSAAQQSLDAALTDYPFAFERLIAETVVAVQPPAARELTSFADLALPVLGKLHDELQRAAAQNLDDYEHLHQVRIIGKRLRYAMEIFADCFAPSFRQEVYAEVAEMQEILGRANDSFVASQRLARLRDQLALLSPADARLFRPGIDGLLRVHRERLPREQQAFRQWWEGWQSATGPKGFEPLARAPRAAA